MRRRPKMQPPVATLDELLGEASWLLSRAEALADDGRQEGACLELVRAAHCEEQVACVLDATGRLQEAGIHRVSAASCQEQVGQYARAVTLLRAALSAPLPEDYRQEVEQLLVRYLTRARKELVRHAV